MKFVDSSIWLDHLGATSNLSSAIIESEEMLSCSILTLFEVKKRLIKLGFSETKILSSIEFIKQRAIIVDLSEEIILSAVDISLQYHLSAIDAIIYTSALKTHSTLVTADNDFRGLKNVEIIGK